MITEFFVELEIDDPIVVSTQFLGHLREQVAFIVKAKQAYTVEFLSGHLCLRQGYPCDDGEVFILYELPGVFDRIGLMLLELMVIREQKGIACKRYCSSYIREFPRL